MKQELHILVGCADARDLNQLQVETVASKTREFEQRGIHVDYHVIRAAGSFITDDVYEDIRNTILDSIKAHSLKFSRTDFFVHIQTHGHLTQTSNRDYHSHLYEMAIVDNSPLNCGMMHATKVALELEEMLVKEQLEFATPHGRYRIMRDEDIRTLLREVYAHDGYLAGDWIRSIDYLRTHPRNQKANLERRIAADYEMKRLGIKITAGIQDYSIHGLIRLDDGEPHVAFWDEIQLEIRERAGQNLSMLKMQAEKQTPVAGLLCTSDPESTSRVLAARWIMDFKQIEDNDTYLPNTVFNITGSTFDLPQIPFGPYVIAGFYYAVKHLGLTDQMVLGHDEDQTERMMRKIQNDPIMNLIVKKFNVNLIPLNQLRLMKN